MSADLIHLSGHPVIIGGGIAGLMTALTLAPEPVLLLSKAPIGYEAASAWAQGGLAASLGADDDVALHVADTLAAGDGLCDAGVVQDLLSAAPQAIDTLIRYGARFDQHLGLEAAHSRRRIVHSQGDGSGREVMRALAQAVKQTPSITLAEGMEARRLLTEDGIINGILAQSETGVVTIATDRVVLATGGVGGLFLDSTNPAGSCGQGLALAARAGARLADLEFIQFHPTALDVPLRPMPLISEAVRGEGAILIDETGARLGGELEPRDVVARAIWKHLQQGRRVFLDARQCLGARFAEHFPVIAAACRANGIDPATDPLPVRPAAHYHMGGIAVDRSGRSSVAGLWAAGEVASTGLHGANRLASNSLTEALITGLRVGEDLSGTSPRRLRKPRIQELPCSSDPAAVRPILSRYLGVTRDEAGLHTAIAALRPLAESHREAADPALVGLMIAEAALARQESRGAHYRTDFPQKSTIAARSFLTSEDVLVSSSFPRQVKS
ncbi:L-aspartate oxidase [Nordella sp. HKS 07]|uniref:L-aspartate oxidase n=1 Tax=Nordella sp. HKS 07 TaxID=2712222 RepID=UPI0013E11CA4|nr:L-aspartate oxidase [Nordella sp. HKS 07]QIG49090.1 L-aspartate oxidase [Nordella sp. HKS 07]